MLNLSIFAERLNDLLYDAQITPPALAAKLGCGRVTIYRYLQGNKIPSLDMVIRLADYFNCTTDFLLGLEEENYPQEFLQCPPFKDRLAFLLEHCKITKYRLQKLSNVPESAIYNWQNGVFEPKIDNIIRIAKALDCSTDFVIGRVK